MNQPPKLPKVIELIRPDDLLNLWIETENLKLASNPSQAAASDATAPAVVPMFLVVDDPKRPALLRVIFPPQHIAEFAGFESDPSPKFTNDPSSADSSAKKAHADREKANADYAAKHPDADANQPLGIIDPNPLPLPGTAQFQARMAAASRLVFRVAPDQRIPYTVEGLLNWQVLEPVLHPLGALAAEANATECAAAPPISAPNKDQTVLELPYRLCISPDLKATWAHRTQPFGAHGQYELWHTRLVIPNDGSSKELDYEHTAPLRAIWSPDYRPDLPATDRNRQGTTSIGLGKLGRSALSDDDRHQLVVLTSACHGYETDQRIPVLSTLQGKLNQGIALQSFIKFGSTPYVPKPFHTSQLILSPLGGWLKSHGDWKPPRTAKVAKPNRIFDTTTSIGLRGMLPAFIPSKTHVAPSGVLVALPDIGLNSNSPQTTAEQLDLSEWVHIASQGRDHYVRVVYEGELWPFRHKAAMVKVTERKFVQRSDGIVVACLLQRVFIVVREREKSVARYDSPLTKVRLTTLITPNLAEPNPIVGRSFWIEVGNNADRTKFRFHAVGTDQHNQEKDFTIPLIFASISDIANPVAKSLIDKTYNADPDRAADFQGVKLAFTPIDNNDNPLLSTRTVLFAADSANSPPRLESAEIIIPAIAELLGNTSPIKIAYDDTGENSYTKHGYVPANATGVFAKLINTLPLGFRADQAGGFATPNQSLTALSRDLGPVAGNIAKAMTDSFEPDQIFPATAPSGVPGLPLLFGTFGLGELLKGGSLSNQAPKVTTTREADAIVTRFAWLPEVVDVLDIGVVEFNKKGISRQLNIKGETRTPIDKSLPSSLFEGTLEDFDISLLKSVTIHFTQFAFSSRNGEKPNIKVALDTAKPLEFSGDLKFIEELRQAIPPGLFGDGASLEVTATGIRAGFAIGLPPLEIGVFALKDVQLGAALTLPFLDGKPILDFNVSERANPFQLRVAFFAGGGFFHLQMDTQGMRQLEASLEFGAAFGLSIAVATGEVHAMAGIYFAITRKDDGKNYCTLTGFMRLGGRLSVIGIIRLSVEFNLSFTYQEDTHKAYGRATVTVMVEVLFISVSVALTVERAFGGAGDPVFLQTFPAPEFWHEYASAFA